VGWYQRVLEDTGRAPAVWMLVAFLVTFAVTRTVTRRIRAKATMSDQEGAEPGKGGGLGDIYIGGVHVHHQVWGILLVLASALLEFRYSPRSPWEEVLAGLFGVGAALTLDEFALWFTLDDVYWSESGRKSIDAILVAGALGAVLLVQATPGRTTTSGRAVAEITGYVVTVAFDLGLALVCIVKGKLATGIIGAVVPLIALVGAIRLAKPGSPWARRWYAGGHLARAERRYGPAYQRRHDRVRDFLGGRPEVPAGSGERSGRSPGG